MIRTDSVESSTWTLVKRVGAMYPRRSAMIVALGFIKSTTEGLALVLLLPILAIFGIGEAGQSTTVVRIRELFASAGIDFDLIGALSAVFALGVVSALLTFAQAALLTQLVRAFVQDIQITTYQRLIAADVFYLVRQRLGDSLGTLIKFSEQAGNGIQVIFRAITDLLQTIVLVMLAFWQAPDYVPVVMLIVALMALPMVLHFRRVGRLVTAAHMQVRKMNAEMGDHLRLAFAIKAFGAQNESTRQVAKEVSRAARLLARIRIQLAAARSMMDPAMLLVLCITVYVGVAYYAVPVDRMLLIVLIFMRIVPRATALGAHLQQMPELAAAYGRVLATQSEASATTPSKGRIEPAWPRLSRDIVFEDVVVGDGGQRILNRASLSVPPSGMTALLGPSGAGKSTLVAALLGLVQPEEGKILVEGIDLASLNGEQWRRRVGFMAQDNPLFHASIRDNLKFSRQDANDTLVWQALDQAGLRIFVENAPCGLDTVVGEAGSRMSGGERQRLALARALLRQPLLLVLDEPTSALDRDTSDRLIETIREISRDVAVLVVTHDLALAGAAEKLHLVDGGTVREGAASVEINANVTGTDSARLRRGTAFT